jgi:hypothetical protein
MTMNEKEEGFRAFRKQTTVRLDVLINMAFPILLILLF